MYAGWHRDHPVDDYSCAAFPKRWLHIAIATAKRTPQLNILAVEDCIRNMADECIPSVIKIRSVEMVSALTDTHVPLLGDAVDT